MAGTADKLSIDIPCPKCGHKFKQSFAELERNPDVSCPACGQHIKIEADAGLKSAKKSLDEFDKAIRNFGKG